MGKVISVASSSTHAFSKSIKDEIVIEAGLGIVGDCHYGEKVQHLSRIAKNPDQPNLRQIHLIHAELFDELASQGFQVQPGDLGENILTRGIDLLNLPQKTKLSIGNDVVLQLTGLRNPCKQINNFQNGLMQALIPKDEEGNLVRKSGVMSIVLHGGTVRPDDTITVSQPDGPAIPLQPV